MIAEPLQKKIRQRVHKGDFLKPCPCSPGAVPCGYWNANLQSGCPYRCSYCILQVYLSDMQPQRFRNWRKVRQELESLSSTSIELRLGTGELSDSLAFDDQGIFSHRILDLMQEFSGIVFEFKTKSDQIRHLLAYPVAGKNIVISWSLNPQSLAAPEEKGAPSLKQRLAALSLVNEKGYRIGIHFDPLILFPDWKKQYRELVRAVAKVLPTPALAWWSLGALRFPPSLIDRFPQKKKSLLFWGELVPGYDGKLRYFKPLRHELFQFLRDEIFRSFSRDIPLYLCMEDAEMWNSLFPGMDISTPAINRRLYESVLKI